MPSALDQLVNMLAQLVGILRPEDLEDPEMAGLMAQLISVLQGRPDLFPPELADQLIQIPDRIERFKAAAAAMGVSDPEELKELAESMRAVGLFKSK